MRNQDRSNDSALANFTLHFEYDKSLSEVKKTVQKRTLEQ